MALSLKAGQYITVIGTPIVVIFGLLGNAMTAAVLTRKRFRSRNISVYLMALAVVDSIFLLSNTMVSLTIRYLGGPDIQAYSNGGCKLAKYVLMSSRAASAWLVVVLTVQRLLAMSIPHLASVLSTRRQAYISTGVVVAFIMVLYSYMFVVVELIVTPHWSFCLWSSSVSERVRTLLNIADLLFYSLIPSIILATCNSILVYMLFYSEELRREATKNCRGGGGSGATGGGADSRSITVILVLMSVSFIVLTLPMTFYQVIFTLGFRPAHPGLIYPSLYMLDLINHAANFLLYCVSGPSFRVEIKDMLSCKNSRARWKNTSGSKSSNTYRRRHRKSADTQSTQETRVNGLNSPPSSPCTDPRVASLYPKLDKV